ncbi:MAG: histidine kinase [Celeribacter sp.]|jgi:hypothetical protein
MKDLIGGSALAASDIGLAATPDDSVNRDRVRQLANEIGPRDFIETTELFLMEIEVALDALSAIIAANLVVDELHFLRGCATNLGMTGLALMCKENSAAARMGEAVDHFRLQACYRSSKARFLSKTCDEFAV